MPRILVTSDDGELVWNERVEQSDFETEHFRRCLADRVSWAVADAEAEWRLSTVSPLRVDRGAVRGRSQAAERQRHAVAV